MVAIAKTGALPEVPNWTAKTHAHYRPKLERLVELAEAATSVAWSDTTDVRMQGVEVRLRPNGLSGLVREVAGSRKAAA